MATYTVWFWGLEKAIEPADRFASANRYLQRIVDSRPPPKEAAEANIRWGASSSFGFKDADQFIYPTHRVNFPPDKDDEEFLSVAEISFSEEVRQTTEKRVENPEDSEQYVIVEVIDSITFSGPDLRPDSMVGKEGRQGFVLYTFRLNNGE